MTHLRLRTVLAAVFLLILALPVAGLLVLRVYESALVRQTESELIGQGAIIAAAYGALLEQHAGQNFNWENYGQALPQNLKKSLDVNSYNVITNEVNSKNNALVLAHKDYHPHPAKLDLARDMIFAPAADPIASNAETDALAQRVGADLAPVLQEAQRVTLAGLRLVSINAKIVASTGDGLNLSLSHLPEVRRALLGEFSTLMRAKAPKADSAPKTDFSGISRTTKLRVVVAMPITHKHRVVGMVLLVRTPANLVQVVWNQRKKIALFGILLLLTTLALAWLTATTITKPLQLLTAQAHRASMGELGAIQPTRRRVVHEVAELSSTLSTMAQTLEERAAYIKNFSAHVSHEFKTPLTAIGGAVELLREHGASMSEAEKARFLGIIADDTSRLDRLTRRLLELARADMSSSSQARSDLALTVRAAAFRASARGQRIYIAEPLPAGLNVGMSAEIVDSIFSGLFDNAQQHAQNAKVHLSIRALEHCIECRISDDGIGISASNAQQIFEPFFTTARPQGNTGLGLTIIRALLRAQKADIYLEPVSKGTQFVLSFPKCT